MSQKKGNPGCPCCTGSICLIQSNDLASLADLTGNFTLEDKDNFDYDATLGGIEISAASQTATADTPHPQSPYPPRVRIEFQADTIGGVVRLILGDAIAAQVTIGDDCAQLDILDTSDDSEIISTLYMPGVAIDEWHRLTICYDPDTAIVRATLLDINAAKTYESSGTYATGGALGRYSAFGTGPSSTGNVYVRNFRYWRLWYCGDSPYTEDCHIEGDDWDYYYELPERTTCYTCTTSCTVVSADFGDYEDGPMPCDWDADATDWEIVSGAATGNGEVCHTFDGTGGHYHVSATFTLGTLTTVGDSVTVSLTNGDTTISLTVTKEAARYKLDWIPSGLTISNGESTEGYLTTQPTSATLRISPGVICGSGGESVFKIVTVTAGDICVSITQPTLSGHVDATMTDFTIIKSSETDPACPESECSLPCNLCENNEAMAYLSLDFTWGAVTSANHCHSSTMAPGDFYIPGFTCPATGLFAYFPYGGLSFTPDPSFIVPVTFSGVGLTNCQLDGELNTWGNNFSLGEDIADCPTSVTGKWVGRAYFQIKWAIRPGTYFTAPYAAFYPLCVVPFAGIEVVYSGVIDTSNYYLMVSAQMVFWTLVKTVADWADLVALYGETWYEDEAFWPLPWMASPRDGHARKYGCWIADLGELPIDCKGMNVEMELFAQGAHNEGLYFIDDTGPLEQPWWSHQAKPSLVTADAV